MTTDLFHLQRFLDAQAPVIGRVREELRGGRKRSHWMWFVFPQIAGLGYSAMAQRYAIGSLDEARTYLDHPELGARYRECVGLAMAIERRDAHAIFGSPDDLKFISSLTLFARAAPDEALFAAALGRFYSGAMDEATLARLA
jgi:uncharacterized protein (DUF1810 family)